MNRHSHDEYEVKTKVVTLSTSSNQTSLLIRELNTNNLTMKEKIRIKYVSEQFLSYCCLL